MGILTRTLALWLLAAPAALAQITPALRPYTACTFDDGLTVTDLSPLPPGVQGRTVDTLTGKARVPLLRGERVLFSYPETDFFANVKVEQLPPDAFEQGKKDLISNFDHILASGNDGARNMTYALKPTLNGFEVHGLDRLKLEGSTLGIYLLIDDRTHIVTTVYFPNQEPRMRKFSTLDEYANLRDHFLNAYTSCVHAPFAVAVSAVAVSAKPTVRAATPAHKTRPPAKAVAPRRKAKPAPKAAAPRHKVKPRPHSQSTNTSAN
jgi:hypothetical protein